MNIGVYDRGRGEILPVSGPLRRPDASRQASLSGATTDSGSRSAFARHVPLADADVAQHACELEIDECPREPLSSQSEALKVARGRPPNRLPRKVELAGPPSWGLLRWRCGNRIWRRSRGRQVRRGPPPVRRTGGDQWRRLRGRLRPVICCCLSLTWPLPRCGISVQIFSLPSCAGAADAGSEPAGCW